MNTSFHSATLSNTEGYDVARLMRERDTALANRSKIQWQYEQL